MKAKKITSLVAASAMILTFVLTGCSSNEANQGGNGEEQITLEYWSSWSENENQAKALQTAAKNFQEDHPNVTINFTFNGRDNRTMVGAAIQSGTKVTMMDANADNIQSMWSDIVLDLTSYFEESYDSTDGKAYIDTIMPSMAQLSADMFGGKYSYFPYAPQGFMIMCNKAIFEDCGITEYPQTWEELMDVCQTIKDKGYTVISSDNSYITGWMGYYLTRLMGKDAVQNLVEDSSAWDDPRVLEAARAIEDMAAKGYFDENIESNVYPNAQQDMVINGNTAMYINGTWLPNEVSETTPEDFQWGQFAFPEVPNGVDDQTSGCYSSYGIAINKDASDEEKEAAAEFGVYVTTDFDQEFADSSNAVPVQIDGTWPDNLAEAKDVLNNYTNRYPSQTALILNSNSKQIISDACAKLMGGTITAEEFVEQASAF